MKINFRCFTTCFLVTLLCLVSARADSPAGAPDEPVLTAMLHSFLAGASRNDPATHQRFWSDRLVYTSSTGARFGKAEILEGLGQAGGAATMIYSAEDIHIQQYGDTAVVAFRLVGRPVAGGTVNHYFNTGTFVKEQGIWQAVAWQATRIPASDGADQG